MHRVTTVRPESPEVTPALLAKYDRPGPRYTSYPTAVEFHDGVDAAAYVRSLARANTLADEALSLYVHLPFCEERCAYCGCNVVVLRRREEIDEYLDHLARELALVAEHLGSRRRVSQLHWGGGTPTLLDEAQIATLGQHISDHFALTTDAEASVEIDPRVGDRVPSTKGTL